MEEIDLDITDSKNWKLIVYDSIYTIKLLSELVKINKCQFGRYVNQSQKPSNKNLEKVIYAMEIASKNKKQKRHPSFGWATKEEIEKITNLGVSPERDRILREIKDRSKRKGKK